ncbi:MAG: hypothetical protein R3A48_27955 [Polyangiales bacterium]
MQEVLVVAIVFAVPISAILSWSRIKLRRLGLEAGAAGNRQVEERLAKLEARKAELEERVGTLESIITLDAPVPSRTRVRVEAAQLTRDADRDDDEAEAAPRRAAR